jgi:hypothetical protein
VIMKEVETSVTKYQASQCKIVLHYLQICSTNMIFFMLVSVESFMCVFTPVVSSNLLSSTAHYGPNVE